MHQLSEQLANSKLGAARAHLLARVLLNHCSATNPELTSLASKLVRALDPIQYAVNKGSRSIWMFGKSYDLTIPQSRCLDILVPRYKSKQPWVSIAFIEEAVAGPGSDSSQDYREIWRDHEIIKDGMIVHGPRRGTVGICPAETNESQALQWCAMKVFAAGS